MTRGESVGFDRIAAAYDATRGGLERGQRIVDGVLPWLRPGPVVEVGVGTGVVAQGLADAGHPVVGIDLSLPMLGHAHGRLGACVAQGDGYRLPVRPRSAPNAVTVWVTQLVPDVGAFLAAVGAVVVPGGRLVIVPAGSRSGDDIDRIIVPMGEILRPRRDGPDDLASLASAAGLRLVERASTDGGVWHSSPNAQADEIAKRSWSSLWDVPDDVWAEVVAPAIAALRALPDADRPRPRSGRFDVMVFEPA